eukprot:5011355-Pleurochrysis_carterae.AAC.1
MQKVDSRNRTPARKRVHASPRTRTHTSSHALGRAAARARGGSMRADSSTAISRRPFMLRRVGE